MTEYILTLIGISTLISVIGMIAPQKSKKYTRLICALCLLCVILRPLPSILDADIFSALDIENIESGDGDSSKEFYAEIYNNTIRNASEEKIADALKDMMVKDLGLPLGEFDVSVKIDDSSGNIVVKQTTVMLRSGAMARDPHAIVSYLEEMLSCSCEIIYI